MSPAELNLEAAYRGTVVEKLETEKRVSLEKEHKQRTMM